MDYRAIVEKLPFTTNDECEVGVNLSFKSADLMDLAGGCPICALTILRLFMKKKALEYVYISTDFDFKKELADWWSVVNESRKDYGHED